MAILKVLRRAIANDKDMTMRDEVVLMLRGAAEYVASMPYEFNEEVRGAGIKKDEWESLRSPTAWRPPHREKARYAFEKAINWTNTLAGIPPTPVTDHYLAATICGLVCPINWRSACWFGMQGLDGVRLIQANGDLQSAREAVTPERLFALILYHSQNVATRPGLKEKQEHEAAMSAAQPELPPSGTSKGKVKT